MSLSEQIEKDYIAVYKAGKKDRVEVLRMLKAAVKNRLVELKRPGGALSDEEMLDVIMRQAKQREDSIEQFTAAERKDLADKEAAELAILREYLPAKLDSAQLTAAIADAIKKVGAAGPQDMGKVIGQIMSAFKGQVDGKEVSQKVRDQLAKA